MKDGNLPDSRGLSAELIGGLYARKGRSGEEVVSSPWSPVRTMRILSSDDYRLSVFQRLSFTVRLTGSVWRSDVCPILHSWIAKMSQKLFLKHPAQVIPLAMTGNKDKVVKIAQDAPIAFGIYRRFCLEWTSNPFRNVYAPLSTGGLPKNGSYKCSAAHQKREWEHWWEYDKIWSKKFNSINALSKNDWCRRGLAYFFQAFEKLKILSVWFYPVPQSIPLCTNSYAVQVCPEYEHYFQSRTILKSVGYSIIRIHVES